jgi:hypothetical protein
MKQASKTLFTTSNKYYKEGASMGRLMTAALVDPSFRQLLLTDQPALASGYNGEEFHLDTKEQDFILSAQAASLLELAEQYVTHQPNGNANGNGSKNARRS